jgi:phosphoglycerol transferase MdoB-like AlkP superfamily enzyme
MKYRKNKTRAVLIYLLTVHFLGLLSFSILRIILYLCNLEQTAGIDGRTGLFLGAMLKGLQFDNLVVSYISLLPLVILSILAIFRKFMKTLIWAMTIFYMIFYIIVIGIAIADIQYFRYFLAHIKTDAIGWIKFAATTAGMIFQEIGNYPFFALGILIAAMFYIIIRKAGKKLYRILIDNESVLNPKIHITVMTLTLVICTVGMRGTLNIYPLRTGDAFFSNYAFYNQLGVNPAFSFFKSIQDVSGQRNTVNDLMTVPEAIATVQKELGITGTTGSNPLIREINSPSEPSDANVVIILMESMSSDYLNLESKGKKLTPYLNELINHSYYFENFYSSGVHTNNGIVSTLYGYPALFDRPSMSQNPNHYTGLPGNLKQAGYQTLFFVTSNPNYDNMNSFLLINNFQRLYSQFDYPKEKTVNNFGVSDEYLFEYGLNTLNQAAKKDKPFLAVFMTVSNHPPYIVPEAYKNISDKEEESILAFVDNTLKTFMENAAHQEWHKNTWFILLGDHGAVTGRQKHCMALSYNHIPCIIHSPLLKDAPKRLTCYGGQIDIFPTVMGLLNRSYTNDSFGIDLMKESRPCMFFSSNNRLGCIDSANFYVRDLDIDQDFLYDLHSNYPENLAGKLPHITSRLKNYAVSMTVTADTLMRTFRATDKPSR